MYDDKEIMQMYLDGEHHQAFNLIVRKYSERLYWHIRKFTITHDDTDDVLQNVFLKVWKALPSFREESSLYTWLYRIATNESLTFIKKERSRTFLSVGDYSEMIENKIDNDPSFNGNTIQRELYKAIAELPPKQRGVFIMRYFDEMKYENISDVLGISVGALKASYHHAYQKIQKRIKELD